MAKEFKFEVVEDNLKDIIASTQFLQDTPVLVGVPEETGAREEPASIMDGESEAASEPVTNADLVFIHTNGSPVNNIPARPIIEPAIEDSKDELADSLMQAANLALDGDLDKAEEQLVATGMLAQNVVRGWFDSEKNGWAPNSPSVAKAKQKKGSTDPKPLIDTGELRKSITYVVNGKVGEV